MKINIGKVRDRILVGITAKDEEEYKQITKAKVIGSFDDKSGKVKISRYTGDTSETYGLKVGLKILIGE